MTPAQHRALHPYTNFWVTASAGSGKTKVLTDRVIRLLLEGVEPAKILCLTFTKAAAAEMTTRIQERLRQWAIGPQESLMADLEILLGFFPTELYSHRASSLYTAFLERPSAIQTLHSFCQTLLQKFPLEAGIEPFFQVLEESSSMTLWQRAYQEVIALNADIPGLTPILHRLSDVYSEYKVFHMLQQRRGVSFRSHQSNLVLPDLTEAQTPSVFTPDRIQQVLAVLEIQGTPREHAILQGIQTLPPLGPEYGALFLTQTGNPKQNVFNRSTQQALKELAAWIQEEQILVGRARECGILRTLWQRSQDIETLFQHVVRRYTEIKHTKTALDFDDLIVYTQKLLNMPEHIGWILYKLDFSLDHILIDEAQDTSAAQWEILKHLGESLLSQVPAHKTFFVVGDPKQSIYGFQGADLETFYEMKSFFQTCAQTFGRPFEEIQLDVSFRSTATLLQGINAVFQGTLVAKEIFPLHKPSPFLKDKGGHVEVWPVWIKEPSTERNETNDETDQTIETKLAHQWAIEIAEWLHTPFYLETRQRPVEPRDILFLFSHRSSLLENLMRELHRQDLPVSGLDRFDLHENLAVRDLMALAQWLVMPEDDWSLAAVLRGSLLGVTEDQVFLWAQDRGKIPLLKRVCANPIYPFFTSESSYGDILHIWQDLARTESPYALFQHILYVQGGWNRMRARLGAGIGPAVEEFLRLVWALQHENGTSLFQMVRNLQASSLQIKRGYTGEVSHIRLLTVHGAKGLQSPIVIIPDAAQPLKSRHSFYPVSTPEGPRVLVSPSAKERTPFLQQMQDAAYVHAKEEHTRLLYVALTRAEERLYISGTKSLGATDAFADSWYPTVQQALQTLAPHSPEFPEHWPATENLEGKHYVLSACSAALPTILSPAVEPTEPLSVPIWATASPLWEKKSPLSPLSPVPFLNKNLDKTVDTNPFHFQKAVENRLSKTLGIVLHQILDEWSQTLGASFQWSKVERFLCKQGLSPLEEKRWTERLKCLISAPHLQTLWGPGSHGEVPIISPRGSVHRIDRLIMQDHEGWIVDFKLGKCPSTWQGVSEKYRQQLLEYAQILQALYPTHVFRQGILWLSEATLQWGPNPMEEGT